MKGYKVYVRQDGKLNTIQVNAKSRLHAAKVAQSTLTYSELRRTVSKEIFNKVAIVKVTESVK